MAENWQMPLEDTDILGKTKSLKLIKNPDLKKDLKEKGADDWIAVFCSDSQETVESAVKLLSSCILNPGCIYVKDNEYELFHVNAKAVRDVIAWPNAMKDDILEYYPMDKRIELDESLWYRLEEYSKQVDLSKRRQVQMIEGGSNVA